MSTEKYEIMLYLSANGTECRVECETKEKYERARAVLDACLKPSPVARDGEPAQRAVYYYVDETQLEDVRNCMRAIQQGR